LLPSKDSKPAVLEQRIQLFERLVGRWKEAISSLAYPLYLTVLRRADSPEIGESLLRYIEILRKTFPDCEREPAIDDQKNPL
jgi:hypothetical protein